MENREEIQDTNNIGTNTLEDELNSLKTAYTDLETKYSQLEEEHNTYKFDVDFKNEIDNIGFIVPEASQLILKDLKKRLDDKEYRKVKEGLIKLHLSGSTPKTSTTTNTKNNEISFEKALEQRR